MKLAVAEVRGFQKAGVAACAKHFPGLANTPVDTHEALAVISGSVDYLWDNDMIPFRAAVENGVASVMVSHVLFEDLDAEYPATLSPVLVENLLRKETEFDGLACTDCMEMKAISDNFGTDESAVLAILSGIDLVFFSHTREMQEQAYEALLEACKSGRISSERLDSAVKHIQVVKEQFAVTETPIG